MQFNMSYNWYMDVQLGKDTSLNQPIKLFMGGETMKHKYGMM